MENEEVLEFSILTSDADPKVIEDAIAEAESELGVSSEVEIGKDMGIIPTELVGPLIGFGVVVVKEFATKFFEKYGESLADWLARKLGLDESKGEGVTESN